MLKVLQPDDLEALALGATVLGGGGGGDPYLSKLIARSALANHGPVQLLDAGAVADDDLVVPLGMIGAPTVVMERIFAADSFVRALSLLERHLGRPAKAVLPLEIGGFNALVPIAVAAQRGLPVIDADLMGRAFPELQMTTPSIYGRRAAPLAIADDRGNQVIIETVDNYWAEKLARSAVVDMGGAVASALYPLSGRELRQYALSGSVSAAIQIGQAFQQARASHHSPIAAIRHALGGIEIFEGKVVDVQRQTAGGFARGQAQLEGANRYAGQTMSIAFQNEYLLASVGGAVRVTPPNLIGVFDSRSSMPIAVESLRYGFHTLVLAFPCAAQWRSPAGLRLVGPRAFGYEVEYIPFEAVHSIH